MAIKARYAQQAMNSYTIGNNPYTYAAQAKAVEEKNVKSGKRLVKVLLVAVAFVGIMHFTTGCTDNSNPVQGLVCSTQNTPSPVCPNAGK